MLTVLFISTCVIIGALIFYPLGGMFVALGYIVYEVVYLQPRGLDKVSKASKYLGVDKLQK